MVVVLEDGRKFNFSQGKTLKAKLEGNPMTYEVLELQEPQVGENLKFSYDAGIGIDEFNSSSVVESIID